MKRNFFIVALMVLFSVVANAQHLVSGKVLYHQNPEYPIEGVQVELINEDGLVFAQSSTDVDGMYFFTDVPTGAYTVNVSTDMPGMEVSMQEAMLILMHLNGSYTLTPMEYMAADVDGNGLVNYADFIFIMINHFIFNQPFPAGNWVFESVQLNAGTKDGSQGIGGSRIGDVEGVWIPTGRDLFDHFEPAISQKIHYKDDEVIDIAVQTILPSELLNGYGLVLNFDPNVVEIIDVEAFGDDAYSYIMENEVRIAWLSETGGEKLIEDVLANLKVRFLKEVDNYMPFTITNESHVLDANGDKIGRLEFSMPMMQKKDLMLLADVYPNPTTNACYFQIEASNTTKNDVMVFDQMGRMVQHHVLLVNEGIQVYEINLENLPAGQYSLTLFNQNTKAFIGHYRIVKQ